MKKSIGVLALTKEMKEDIVSLFKNEVEKGDIIIEVLEPKSWKEQGLSLQNKGVNAIVTRSGVFRDLDKMLRVPVVQLKVNTFDILNAVKRASFLKKPILFLQWTGVYSNYEEWREFIGQDVTIEKFNETDEIEDILLKYLDKKANITVIGGGVGVNIANNMGFETVFLNASKESIWDTITRTMEMVDRINEEKYKNYLLEKVIDHVHDSVIVIDEDKKIIHFNQQAETIFDRNAEDVINKLLHYVFPDMNFISDCMTSGESIHDKIKFINGKNINTSVLPIDIEGYMQGALCIFEDVTELQNLEKKIRFELNKKGLKAKYSFDDIIFSSDSMREIINRAKLISKSESTVIIYGESGTGKELIAQSIHQHSNRRQEPFVAINCAAISNTLLESELFGYEYGAFTGARKGGKPGLFEIAHGGTIFLDEINSISPEIQSKLLRVIEEKEVMRIGSDYIIPLNVRIIAATNEDLYSKVEECGFRSDLFYRLSTLEITLPPLRERKEDIVLLFKYFYQMMNGDMKKYKIGDAEEKILMNQSWNGNIRELKNVVQRYIMFGNLDVRKTNDFSIQSIHDFKEVLDFKKVNRYIEKKIIMMLLEQGLSKSEVAKMLGISRASLWNKLHSNENED